MVEELIQQVAIILGLSVLALLIFHRLKIPALIGFILTGILVGPHGFGIVSAVEEVETLAEIGVILLLFTIGLEFSFKDLRSSRGPVALAGGLQIVLTIMVAAALATWAGQPAGAAVFIGFLVALSSTAVVLRILQERGELEAPHGRTAVAILILQDLAIVPMMLFTPMLAGTGGDIGRSLIVLAATGAAILLLVYVGGRWAVPRLLYEVARTRSRELFMLVVVAIVLGVAWLMSLAGLSLALGAFLAGLVVGQSEYSRDALSRVMPLKDVFTTFFFVSIGMLFDTQFVLANWTLVAAAVVGVMLLKAALAAFAISVAGFSIRTAVLGGLALSQVGEFAFILSQVGLQEGLLTPTVYQTFLATAVVTMALTPYVIGRPGGRLVAWLHRLPRRSARQMRLDDSMGGSQRTMRDHLFIIGYGNNGRTLARVAREAEIPHMVLDTNPESVRKARAAGEPVFWGDATHEAVLEHCGVAHARVIVVAISDAAATRAVTATCRALNKDAVILVRTAYVTELKPLMDLGADEVISQEFEASVEILSRVLNRYTVPRAEIDAFVERTREAGYAMFRSPSPEATQGLDLRPSLPGHDVQALRVSPTSPVVAMSLEETALRRRYGVTLLAIRRAETTITNPPADYRFLAGDVMVVLGKPEDIRRVAERVQATHEPPVDEAG